MDWTKPATFLGVPHEPSQRGKLQATEWVCFRWLPYTYGVTVLGCYPMLPTTWPQALQVSLPQKPSESQSPTSCWVFLPGISAPTFDSAPFPGLLLHQPRSYPVSPISTHLPVLRHQVSQGLSFDTWYMHPSAELQNFRGERSPTHHLMQHR